MSHETVEPLIPWFANGTLDDDERRTVTAHLRECARCRAMLDLAREQERAARHADLERRAEDVHPRLLTEYAEDPDRLDAETRTWIERRLERSAISREALERLREVADPEETAPRGDAPSTPRAASLWEMLSATFLRPAPALGYLVLLLALAPAVWLWRERGMPDAAGTPRIVDVAGERALRSDAAGSDLPLRIEAPPDGRIVLLELDTGLSAFELRDLDAAFVLEIRRADRIVWSERIGLDRFRPRGDRSIVPLTLQPGRFAPNRTHVITLFADKPGDPVDGQALFRRSFEFVKD